MKFIFGFQLFAVLVGACWALILKSDDIDAAINDYLGRTRGSFSAKSIATVASSRVYASPVPDPEDYSIEPSVEEERGPQRRAMLSPMVYKSCVSPKMFAMTFDEGPNYQNTEKILAVLRQKGVEATFHIAAEFLPEARNLARSIVAGGHLLGLRFDPKYTDLRKLSEQQIRSIMKRDHKLVYESTGVNVKYLRLPFNGYSDKELKVLSSMGYIVTEHNLESYDFQEGKLIPAFKNKLKECKGSKCPGLISIQREASAETAKRLPALIEMIDEVGYNFVKLNQCIGK